MCHNVNNQLVTKGISMSTRNAEATKRRILDAAIAEFSEHGMAGARVDRIAEAADVNKRMIYVYFGNKAKLFETVIEDALDRFVDEVPFTPEDLPGYAGVMFDHLVRHPELLRLNAWRNLESPGTTDEEKATYKKKVEAIAEAQQQGTIDEHLAAVDVLALVLGLTTAWFMVSEALRALADGDLADRRSAIVDAVANLTAVRE